MDDSLRRYLEDVRNTRRVDPDEEARLFKKCREGSREARNRLIQAHMRFVLKVALHYRNGPLPVADLISEGALGLIRAIESYDGSRGVKFLSYAVWWIRSYISKALENKGHLIRIPANQHVRIRKEKAKGAQDGNSNEGLGSLFPIGSKEGNPQSWENILSASARAEGHADSAFHPEVRMLGRAFQASLDSLLVALPPKENFVIRNLFGIEQEEVETLREVAEDMGMSLERVRQLRELGLARMRTSPMASELKAAWTGMDDFSRQAPSMAKGN